MKKNEIKEKRVSSHYRAYRNGKQRKNLSFQAYVNKFNLLGKMDKLAEMYNLAKLAQNKSMIETAFI